jgi:hypothetical protein
MESVENRMLRGIFGYRWQELGKRRNKLNFWFLILGLIIGH